jgi:hypothetical protein
MKRSLTLLALLPIACSPPAENEPVDLVSQALGVFVQANSVGPRTPQQNVSLAFPANSMAGNLVVAFVGWNDTTSSATSVTDSLGNTYQLAIGPNRNSAGPVSQSVYYAANIAAGANTVTAHFNQPAAFVDLRIAEYSGLATTNPLDATASGTGSNSNASINITTTVPNDVLVAGDVTSLGTTAGSGWTERAHTQPNDDIIEDMQAPTAASYAATMTISGSWVMQAVAFKPKGATDAGSEASLEASSDAISEPKPDVSQGQDAGPDVVDAATKVDADAGATTCSNVFPLHSSIDNRTLVANDGTPFPILGRTAWFVASLNAADQNAFLDDSQAKGYNAVEFMMITHDQRANHPPFDGSGNAPFLKLKDGTAWNGSIGPTPDFTTPNEAYWQNLDALFANLENRGILALAFPAYIGVQGQGWDTETQDLGSAKMQQYATWVATRYANRKNIVWMVGGDQGTFNSAQNGVQTALLAGLQSVGQPNRYYSAEWATEMASTDQTTFGPQMTLNGDYSFNGDVITVGRRAYSYPQTRPAFLLEEPYDQEGPDGLNFNGSATQPTRRFQWMGWLATIGGYMSGNGYVWQFNPGWQTHLNTQCAMDMARLNAFIRSKNWPALKPEGLGGVRTIVTNKAAFPPVAAAGMLDGSLAIIYVSPGYSGTITVDFSVMGHTFTAKWFDPTAATYSTIGTFAPSGTHTFSFPPGNNATGDTDWAMVLE